MDEDHSEQVETDGLLSLLASRLRTSRSRHASGASGGSASATERSHDNNNSHFVNFEARFGNVKPAEVFKTSDNQSCEVRLKARNELKSGITRQISFSRFIRCRKKSEVNAS